MLVSSAVPNVSVLHYVSVYVCMRACAADVGIVANLLGISFKIQPNAVVST